jgi:FkbM family methyltransferase
MKRQLRELQTYFPWLPVVKFAAYNAATRHFGRHMDRDFRLLSLMRPVGLAIDVGGNWGQSIEALRYTAKPERIVSFEPNPELAAGLARRYAGSGDVRIESCGLGAENSTLTLHVPVYRKFVLDGLASIDEDEARGWLNPDRMARFDAQRLTLRSHVVPVRRLDDLDLRPDVVKIDVQGAEEAVVRGGIRTFTEFRPVSIVEAPSDSLVALFGGIGLSPYDFRNGRLRRHDGAWKNTIFLSTDHIARLPEAARPQD